ncbi:MAG: glycosyltransferase [Flavobacteriales bacterium]|nr:glycosyltransferase [Flavobacteriales bacterium]MCC6939119.1 glycosyltransferase [Flavobacteriales bacterium]
MADRILHIIIPCYNPPAGWDLRLIDQGTELMRRLSEVSLRFTVVEDGSAYAIDEARKRAVTTALGEVEWLAHSVNRGKGAALRTGASGCTDGPCLFTDVDVPYTVDSMVDACRALLAGANVVLGQRKSTYYERVPWARRVISKSFRWVLRHIVRLPITDTQCGLKGFDQRGREVFLSTTIDRFLFDMEFVMLVSRRKDLGVETIDAQLDEGIRFSRMNYRILLGESVNFLKVLLRGYPK